MAFTLRLGQALHRHGTPAHRLEEQMRLVSQRLGLEARFFSTPTAIFASFGPPEALRTCLIRVEPGALDLGRLARLDTVAEDVIHDRLSADKGAELVEAILAEPPRYGRLPVLLCWALAAGAWARLFGGSVREMAVAALGSFLVGLLDLRMQRNPTTVWVLEPVGAILVSALSVLAASLLGPLSIQVATLAGLIVLLPGLSLTVALFSVSILFRARPRDWGWIALAGTLAFTGSRLGAQLLGPQLGAFLGALIAGVASNLLGRVRDRPTIIALVPAIMLLVPGSIGFRSLESLMARDVLAGVDTAFSMLMVAVALVAGLLFANALVQPRKVP